MNVEIVVLSQKCVQSPKGHRSLEFFVEGVL